MVTSIIKRDGRAVSFELEKITDAIEKAFTAQGALREQEIYDRLAKQVLAKLEAGAIEGEPTVEGVQDLVEEVLAENGFVQVARAYIKYRAERSRAREMNTKLMQTIDRITHQDAKDNDIARENANIDADTAMGTMLKYGSETAKQYYQMSVLAEPFAKAHREGDIHIHDLDFYTLTTTCCQIDITKLFKGGFSTGHGVLREPSDITSYSALACIAIQSNQNDQHGGQSISNFDYGMAEGVKKTYRRFYRKNLAAACELLIGKEAVEETGAALAATEEHKGDVPFCVPDECAAGDAPAVDAVAAGDAAAEHKRVRPLCAPPATAAGASVAAVRATSTEDAVAALIARVEGETGTNASLVMDVTYAQRERAELIEVFGIAGELADRIQAYAARQAWRDTDKATHQAMEAFIHNLNTMHSRAGAQTPFSSINYGMDTSAEGRMVIRNVLLATEEGLGGGETPIFPIQIFRVKEGVSYNPGDPNYDLFQQACATSAKRLFPNFSFMDASFNAQYYKGTPETEVAYMGCRTRVIGNSYDPSNEVTPGRGNLSFTSINLPRLAIRSKGDIDLFFDLLDDRLRLVCEQLLERYRIQAAKKVYNMPFLMGQGVWSGSDDLDWDSEVGEVLKHGTLSVGFIGLAETLVSLLGEHHGQSERAQNLGLDIVGHMRTFLDRKAAETNLNFSLLATPAEGLSGRFVRIDAERFGVMPGITDREYYTNSFHIPVHCDINAFKKIELEAPYHALTNAGHISYIELDGDPTKNLDAFEAVIRHMKESGVGYGSVNHPVDRDPVCGYNGIIGERCPKCGREEGDVPFERIRRITGYLVGTLDRFNNGKRAEERDRVKHGVTVQ
ncbi:MAG: anaerobic ribonucleoside triphosphate reductase [Coriobacteriales bacterium]|jgi:ribonucleoside-triphosphate reductase|nr:anaerobic ribonucleoside triphosphate reductase [Coriobacteriales bacterium]